MKMVCQINKKKIENFLKNLNLIILIMYFMFFFLNIKNKITIYKINFKVF